MMETLALSHAGLAINQSKFPKINGGSEIHNMAFILASVFADQYEPGLTLPSICFIIGKTNVYPKSTRVSHLYLYIIPFYSLTKYMISKFPLAPS